jgi:hypothetical protein
MPDEAIYPDGFGPGWEPRPEEVEAVQGELPIPAFGQAPADEIPIEDIPDDMLGWKMFEKATGKPWPVINQGSIGSCVAHGTVNAIYYTMGYEIANGDREEWKPLSRETIYGGSRVEVGKGRLGRGDGSIGAWAAKFVNQWGIVAEEKVGPYDVGRCKQYGANGVPDDIEKLAKEHPIAEVTLVTSFEQACKALSSGYGISICSGQGFSMTRDKDGFCAPRGHWSHCMALIGYRKDGPRPGCVIVNSWGANTTSGPQPDGLPASAWWCEASVINRILKEEDSWAFSGVNGFPARKLNWVI